MPLFCIVLGDGARLKASLGASFFGCFQPCWFFQMPLPSFCFVSALYVAWVFFYVGLFSVRTFFFSSEGYISSTLKIDV
jgi:hypothetical protein